MTCRKRLLEDGGADGGRDLTKGSARRILTRRFLRRTRDESTPPGESASTMTSPAQRDVTPCRQNALMCVFGSRRSCERSIYSNHTRNDNLFSFNPSWCRVVCRYDEENPIMKQKHQTFTSLFMSLEAECLLSSNQAFTVSPCKRTLSHISAA